ncbi:hypothetical protein NDU88_004497 [Pleurodeles waltl]|uniref:Uncharacterized protein n=1 Tax=Pleurodeles waltl TaxID=8319 RepID=A0AAV7LUT2_PLEWA|nr:hypothetical protein NDU88_004497 [Pleurodeles waltl]
MAAAGRGTRGRVPSLLPLPTSLRRREQSNSSTRKADIVVRHWARRCEREEVARPQHGKKEAKALTGVAWKETQLQCAAIEREVMELEGLALASGDPQDQGKLKLKEQELWAMERKSHKELCDGSQSSAVRSQGQRRQTASMAGTEG